MTQLLPEALMTFFAVSNGVALTQLSHCFAPNAVVMDEGQCYHGYDAIACWLHEAQQKYAYSIEPLQCVRQGEWVTVVAKVVGDFPGSPVQLRHLFKLADDKILSLEIS